MDGWIDEWVEDINMNAIGYKTENATVCHLQHLRGKVITILHTHTIIMVQE